MQSNEIRGTNNFLKEKQVVKIKRYCRQRVLNVRECKYEKIDRKYLHDIDN